MQTGERIVSLEEPCEPPQVTVSTSGQGLSGSMTALRSSSTYEALTVHRRTSFVTTTVTKPSFFRARTPGSSTLAPLPGAKESNRPTAPWLYELRELSVEPGGRPSGSSRNVGGLARRPAEDETSSPWRSSCLCRVAWSITLSTSTGVAERQPAEPWRHLCVAPAAEGFAWIGLYRPSEDDIRSVARELNLHQLVVDDAIARTSARSLNEMMRSSFL
jgi:Mg2+ and Co2+ transporter CorA